MVGRILSVSIIMSHLSSVLPAACSMSRSSVAGLKPYAIFLITDSTAFTLAAMSSPGILYLILFGPSIL